MYAELFNRLGRSGALFFVYFITIFWISLSSVPSNAASEIFIDDARILIKSNSQCELTVEGAGNIHTVNPVFYADPPRLVYDFTSAILRFNKGQTKRFSVGKGDLREVCVAQNQVNPNIVRIVYYFEKGNEKTLPGLVKQTIKGKTLVFTYPDSSDIKLANPVGIESPVEGANVVKKLYHKRLDNDSDRLILESSGKIDKPSSNSMPGWITFTFDDLAFDLPSDVGLDSEFNVPVKGSIIDEIRLVNHSDAAILKLKLKESENSSAIEEKYFLRNGNELEINLVRNPDIKSKPDDKSLAKQPENSSSLLDKGSSTIEIPSSEKKNPIEKASVPPAKSDPSVPTLKPDYVEVKRSLKPDSTLKPLDQPSLKPTYEKKADPSFGMTLVDDDIGVKGMEKLKNLKIEEIMNSGMEEAIEGAMPVAMLMLFNKETSSYTLYMLYYRDGNLSVRHYP